MREVGLAMMRVIGWALALAASLGWLAAVVAVTAIGAEPLRAAMGLEGVAPAVVMLAPPLLALALLAGFVLGRRLP